MPKVVNKRSEMCLRNLNPLSCRLRISGALLYKFSTAQSLHKYQCFFTAKICDRPPPPTQDLLGPSGPEPRESPQRVRTEYPGRRAPKVPEECAPESQKSPKRVRKSGFRLLLDSFETRGRTLSALLGRQRGEILFPDSFRTLSGFRARRARETLCGAGPIASKDLQGWPH